MSRGGLSGIFIAVSDNKGDLKLLIKPIKILVSEMTEKDIKKPEDLTIPLLIGTTKIYWNRQKRRCSLYSKRIEEFIEKEPSVDNFVNKITTDLCKGRPPNDETKDRVREYLSNVLTVVYLALTKNKFDPHPLETSNGEVVGTSDSLRPTEIYLIAKLIYNLLTENEN